MSLSLSMRVSSAAMSAAMFRAPIISSALRPSTPMVCRMVSSTSSDQKKGVTVAGEAAAAAAARVKQVPSSHLRDKANLVSDADRNQEAESAATGPTLVSEKATGRHDYTTGGKQGSSAAPAVDKHKKEKNVPINISVAGAKAANTAVHMKGAGAAYEATAVTEADKNQEAESAATGPTLVTERASTSHRIGHTGTSSTGHRTQRTSAW